MSSQSARRFHFLKEIASGGFGTVYLAKVMHADGFSRLAAIKLLQTQWTDSEEVSRRIRDEARLLGLLRHRNIVDVLDLTSIDGRTAVIMEYLEGVDLRFVVQELAAAGERMQLRAALEITAACASALDAAYNRPPIPGDKPLRVIHRDIKPSNIMVDGHGSIKVLDFGVARSDIENRESHTQELQFGSVDYMAPERLFFEPETPASDIYSLGATLYELLALEKLGKARGRPQKHAAHLTDRLSFMRAECGLAGTVGGELESLVRAMLDFEHERRPSAADVQQRAKALARLADDEELGAWAERVLPPMILAWQEQPRPASKLSDSVLTEDSQVFQVQDDSAERPIPGSVPVKPGGALPAGGLNPEAALGDEVRRGALAELQGAEVVAPQPATGAPAAVMEPEPDDVSAWDDDGPTKVGSLEQQLAESAAMAAALSSSQAPPADPFGGRSADPALDATVVAEVGDMHNPLQPGGFGGRQTVVPRTVAAEPPRALGYGDQVWEGEASAPAARKKRGLLLPMVLGAGCLMVMVGSLAVGGVFALDLGGVRTTLVAALSGGGSDLEAVPSGPEDRTEEAAAVSDAGAAQGDGDAAADGGAPAERVGADEPVPSGPSMEFQAADEGIKKLRVTCDGEQASGKRIAALPLASAKSCMVTAVKEDRSRLTATVDGATAGVYRCFEGGASTCIQ